MVTDLQASDHGRASRLIPLWLGSRIGPGFWLWAGLRTLLLGLLICGIILQVSTV
jgi:hypothetical protein